MPKIVIVDFYEKRPQGDDVVDGSEELVDDLDKRRPQDFRDLEDVIAEMDRG